LNYAIFSAIPFSSPWPLLDVNGQQQYRLLSRREAAAEPIFFGGLLRSLLFGGRRRSFGRRRGFFGGRRSFRPRRR